MAKTTLYQRTLCDFSNPDRVMDESKFAALIANDLSSMKKGVSYLILAEPGDGSSTFVSNLETNLRSVSDTELNFANLSCEALKLHRFPYTVKCLFGEGLKKPFERLKIRWFSLTLSQRVSYVGLYAAYLYVLHIVTTLLKAWQSPETVELTSKIFYHFPAFAPFAAKSLIGTLLPALGLVIWRFFWRSLSDDELKNKRSTIVTNLRRNNYYALKRKFRQRFIKSFAPIIIGLDSLDNLDENTNGDGDFDFDFLFKELPESYSAAGYLFVQIIVSKFPSTLRTKFTDSSSAIRIYSLLNLTTEQLAQLSKGKVIDSCSVKKALQLGLDDELLTVLDKSIKHSQIKFDIGGWDTWSLMCLLAASSYTSRKGFTRKSFQDLLSNHAGFLNEIAAAFEYKANLDDPKIDRNVTAFFNSSFFDDWVTKEEDYRIDPFVQKRIMRKAAPASRSIGYIFWLYYISLETRENVSAFACAELMTIADKLKRDIPALPQKSDLLEKIQTIIGVVLENIMDKGYGEASSKLAILYFMLQEPGKAYESITLGETFAFESMLIFGKGTPKDIAELEKYLSDRSANCKSIELFSTINSKDQKQRQASRELADKIGRDAEPRVKILLDWMENNQFRHSYVLPLIAMHLRSETRLVDDFPLLTGAKTAAGGFNLGTFSALSKLSDATLLMARKIFEDTWNLIATGVRVYESRSNASDWDNLWAKIVNLILFSELIEFLVQYIPDPLWYQQDYRQNISIGQVINVDPDLFYDGANRLGLKIQDNQLGHVPVSWLKQLESIFQELRLKLLLLSLPELETMLAYYQSRFTLNIRNFAKLNKLVREDVFRDLQKAQNLKTIMIRDTLKLESLLVSYRLDVGLHKKLAARYIYPIVKALDSFGSSMNILPGLYDVFITDLRFSETREERRMLLKLQLKKHQSFKKQKLKKLSDGEYLTRIDFYFVMASDFFNYGKVIAAKSAWRVGNAFLENFIGDLTKTLNLSFFRDMEIKSFCMRVRIWNLSGPDVRSQIQIFFDSDDYKSASDITMLSLINLCISEPSFGGYDQIERALNNISNYDDWFGGYLLSTIFSKIGLLMIDSDETDKKRRLFQLANKSFQLLKNSDQTAIRTEETLETLRYILADVKNLSPGIDTNEFSRYYRNVMKIQLAAIYRSTMTTWMLEGNYGRIADSYYRLLRSYVISQLPDDVLVLMDIKSDSELIAEGIRLIKQYQKGDDAQVWPLIHIIRVAEMRTRGSKNTEVQEVLKNSWLRVSVKCVEGLLEAVSHSTALSDDLKAIVKDHLKDIRSFTPGEHRTDQPADLAGLFDKYEKARA